MRRYRLDPEKPRQLTPAEAWRLDEMPIDCSDIPPLGDDFFTRATAPWPPGGAVALGKEQTHYPS